jgi:hypothetical protein
VWSQVSGFVGCQWSLCSTYKLEDRDLGSTHLYINTKQHDKNTFPDEMEALGGKPRYTHTMSRLSLLLVHQEAKTQKQIQQSFDNLFVKTKCFFVSDAEESIWGCLPLAPSALALHTDRSPLD